MAFGSNGLLVRQIRMTKLRPQLLGDGQRLVQRSFGLLPGGALDFEGFRRSGDPVDGCRRARAPVSRRGQEDNGDLAILDEATRPPVGISLLRPLIR
jgi:hypothetical protein